MKTHKSVIPTRFIVFCFIIAWFVDFGVAVELGRKDVPRPPPGDNSTSTRM